MQKCFSNLWIIKRSNLFGFAIGLGSCLGLAKFGTTHKHDTNPTQFSRVWVEYNRVGVEYNRVWVIFVLTRLTCLINESYSC